MDLVTYTSESMSTKVTISTTAPLSDSSKVSLPMYNATESEDSRVRTDHVYLIIFTYVSPFLIVIGTVGNILSLIVLQSKYFRDSPSSFIMSALACTDSGVLICGLTRHWIVALTDYKVDIRHMSIASCWTHYFFIYVLWELSSWSLALLTIERMASVKWPFRAKQMFSRNKMIVAWMTVTLCLAVINSHWFVTIEFKDDYCYDVEESQLFMYQVWPWLDLVLSSLAPLTIIVTCNIIIISTLLNARKLRRDQMRASTADESESITAMLVGISITFILATLPACIYLIGSNYWPVVTYEQQYADWTAWGVALMAYYISSSTNFIVYCVSGSKFRRSLVAVLCCQEIVKPNIQITNMTGNGNTNTAEVTSPSQIVTTVA